MKRQLFLIFFMMTLIFAQGKRTPLNPDFVEYIKNGGDGGIVPAPFSLPKKDLSQLSKSLELPLTYDLRDSNYVTSVKNQGACGSCWAFATMATVESHWLKKYGEYTDLSENNMKNRNGFVRGPCNGGNYYVSTAYLSRGDGPVYEIDDPYQENNGFSDAFRPDKWIGNVRVMPAQNNYSDEEIPGYTDIIKTNLMKYGAIATVYYDDNSNYKVIDGYTTYYEDEDKLFNHGVTIVGWNDTLRTPADKQGAWLIKNSWGTQFGDDGYFYISYYDKTMNALACFWPERVEYNSKNYIHGLDYTGLGAFWGNEIDPVGHVLMKAELWNQNISHISTYNYFSGGNLYVEIYNDFIDGNLKNMITSGQRIDLEYTGLYTVELDSIINIEEKQDIFIKVTYDLSASGYLYPIPIETKIEGHSDPVISQGFFWTSFDGETWDNSLDETADPCIKLFGEYTGLQPDLAIGKRNFKPGETVVFKDHSKGAEEITHWKWNFGDGNESVEQNPVHTYDSTGIYDVQLVVTSENYQDTLFTPKAVVVDTAHLITPLQLSRQDTLQPTFYWNAPGISSFHQFQLTLGSDPWLQKDTVAFFMNDTGAFTMGWQLSDNTIYYWTVTAHDSTGLTIPYDTLSFAVDLMAEAPAPFTLKFPGSDAGGLGEVLSFIWTESTDSDPWDVVRYSLQIGKDAALDSIVFATDSIDATHYVMTTPLDNNKKYYWRILAKDLTGNITPSVIDSFTIGSITGTDERNVPGIFQLAQNYPNPFNPETTIKYSLKDHSLVRLTVYNSLGEVVEQLVDRFQSGGNYQVNWNAASYSSGIYFFKLECHSKTGKLQYQSIRKMLFIK